MFSLFKKNRPRVSWQPGQVYATQNGTAVPLSDVPDDVIKDKILGDGIAIIPNDGIVVSPVDAEIVSIADSSHAFCLRTPDGIDFLIHIGVDTVALKGEGFRVYVKAGDTVGAGEVLCDVDLKFLRHKGFDSHTAILISNPELAGQICTFHGKVKAGTSVVLAYK